MQSFPCASAGLHPLHLKDLTCDSVEKGGKDLVYALSCMFWRETLLLLITIFLWGFTHSPEKEGRWHTSDCCGSQNYIILFASCAGLRIAQSMGTVLAPSQLGYRILLGC